MPSNLQLVEETAQGFLDAGALYPDSSLADLHDELTMPPELRKAHQANAAAVRMAYGFDKGLPEEEVVARFDEVVREADEGRGPSRAWETAKLELGENRHEKMV